MGAIDLARRVRADLAGVAARIRDHPWLELLEAGTLSRDALQAFVGEQLEIIASDRRSFALLAERFPQDPAGSYFREMVAGEDAALSALEPLAAAVELVGERRTRYEPIPGCQAYPAFVARLARDAGPAEVAAAFLVNLEAWGAGCARARDSLRTRYGLPAEAVRFFELFAEPAPGFEGRSLEVIDAWARDEQDERLAARAARMLQAYELLYWDSLPG